MNFDRAQKVLKKLIWSKEQKIDNISYFLTKKFYKPKEVIKKNFRPCKLGFRWKMERKLSPEDRESSKADLLKGELSDELSLGNNCWFRLRFSIPKEFKGKPVWLKFRASLAKGNKGPLSLEALCYHNGKEWQAFSSTRNKLLLIENAKGGENFDLLIEVGTTTHFKIPKEEFVLTEAAICTERSLVKKLWQDFKILNELRKCISKSATKKIENGLKEAIDGFPFEGNETELVKASLKAIKKLERLKDLKTIKVSLTCLGHSHQDLAWLWPWSETVRKASRTSASMLKLMKEYPEFKFIQSQPPLYEFLRNQSPSIFKRIKEKIKRGQWVPIGGTWAECDLNCSGSEALVRQFLYGKRYFRKHFDLDPKITFLPDSFGFSPALPQISKKAGCPYFLTTKISWNDTNEFPYHTFRWEGIDGSTILAHLPPSGSYSSKTGSKSLFKASEKFKESNFVKSPLHLFGIGNGGGGPTRQMLENLRSCRDLGFSLHQRNPKNFFNELEKKMKELPKWIGELYLERHRGTYTSQARTKRRNRKAEFALREAEFLSTVAFMRNGLAYEQEKLERAWKILLFNQFHDILPGTSIREVYVDSRRDLRETFNIANEIIEQSTRSLFNEQEKSDLYQLVNSLSWPRTSVIEFETDKEEIKVESANGEVMPSQEVSNNVIFLAKDIPSLGTKAFRISEGKTEMKNEIFVSKNMLENSKIKVRIGKDGYIKSIFDKKEGREVINGKANELVLYEDKLKKLKSMEAWNLDKNIFEKGKSLPKPSRIEVLESGPVRGKLRQIRNFGDSKFIQDIIIYKGSKRIDFETNVDWHESRRFLKAWFPIAVHINQASFETQFGHYYRPTHSNTSWQKAKFEVPHQKWVDLSEFDYGAAVLNDCKHGVSVRGKKIGLSLLRAPKSPDPRADQGKHKFVYSFLPHKGSLQESVIQEAYELNVPLQAVPVKSPKSWSLLQLNKPGIIVESIKKAEDSDEIVLRFYEAWGRKVKATCKLGFNISKAWKTNLLEEKGEKLQIEGNSFTTEFSPFEIKTILLKI